MGYGGPTSIPITKKASANISSKMCPSCTKPIYKDCKDCKRG